jgi:hypothetical protein
MVDALYWSASSLSIDTGDPAEGRICAAIWPTHSLNSPKRWFDELSLWPDGFEPSPAQRAQIQLFALQLALKILADNHSNQLAITLSFGTVERCLHHLAEALETHAPDSERLLILLRGSFERLRDSCRLLAFVEFLRGVKMPVGYYLTAPRVCGELKALGFLQPDFAKVAAPTSTRIERWEDLALETGVAGVPFERLIVARLQTQQQLTCARLVGMPFGQGGAIAPAHAPPGDESLESAAGPDEDSIDLAPALRQFGDGPTL